MVGFFAAAFASACVLAALAPEVFASSLGAFGKQPGVRLGFVVLLAVFLAVVTYGVVRRWRWIFWLVVVAFVTGVLRVPATILELARVIPMQGPAWYLILQAAIGVVQLAIGALLIRGYRTSGVWGAF